MAKVELTIKFTDGAQSPRSEILDIETSYPGDLAGEHRVAHILFTELKVTVGEPAALKHNAVARRWLDFPNQPAGIERGFTTPAKLEAIYARTPLSRTSQL